MWQLGLDVYANSRFYEEIEFEEMEFRYGFVLLSKCYNERFRYFRYFLDSKFYDTIGFLVTSDTTRWGIILRKKRNWRRKMNFVYVTHRFRENRDWKLTKYT